MTAPREQSWLLYVLLWSSRSPAALSLLPGLHALSLLLKTRYLLCCVSAGGAPQNHQLLIPYPTFLPTVNFYWDQLLNFWPFYNNTTTSQTDHQNQSRPPSFPFPLLPPYLRHWPPCNWRTETLEEVVVIPSLYFLMAAIKMILIFLQYSLGRSYHIFRTTHSL